MASTSASPRPAREAGRPSSGPAPTRRTVTIRGQATPPRRSAGAAVGPHTRRPSRRAHERLGARPDRVAMYAVLLGVMLVLAAALSAHA